MITSRIESLQSGEHDRGLVYCGPGPLVAVGGARVSRRERRPQFALDSAERFSWMTPTLAGSYRFTTDRGRPLVLCSLIEANQILVVAREKMGSLAGRAHDLLLDGVKYWLDVPGRGDVHRLAHLACIMYMGTHSDHGDRIVRTYFTSVGEFEGAPVMAEVATCATKREEKIVLTTLGAGAVNRMH